MASVERDRCFEERHTRREPHGRLRGAIVMLRVLVIDDDHLVAAAIQMILARKGIESALALDAHAGLQAFVSSKFDVVIVDIFMPGMNGLETITAIRRQAPKIPLIAMSGFRLRDTLGLGLDFLGMAATLGATSCLRKPFAPQQLLGAISSGLTPRDRSTDNRNLERDHG
jgi:CheY-like chemotaxis protein